MMCIGMCVDKNPAAITDFAALVAESAAPGPAWALLVAAALSGRADGRRPKTRSRPRCNAWSAQ